jgi:hypothetical protein
MKTPRSKTPKSRAPRQGRWGSTSSAERRRNLTRHTHVLPDQRLVTRDSTRTYTHVVVAQESTAGTWWLAEWCLSEVHARRRARLLRLCASVVQVEAVNHGVRS